MDDRRPKLHLVLTIVPEKLPLFTTVLQSGIEITTPAGTSLGQFLGTLPGFSADYLANTVQTVFHNGTAVDDLTVSLCGETPVLALSAAMPGLAGAIFRRNSFHAALRSETQPAHPGTGTASPHTVTLKLFNAIAQDRGPELLAEGVRLRAGVLSAFFMRRPELMQAVVHIQLEEKEVSSETLLKTLALADRIDVKIHGRDKNSNG